MFVGRRMTRNLITVAKDTSILKVKNLMNQYKIRQLPVVRGKELIGIVSDRDIRENSASPASTLSVHELNYLLSEMKAGDIMTRNVWTVSPGTTIEEAAKLISDKNVNSLPVVVDNELIGIITTSDLLSVLVEFMGIDMPSSRIELTLSSDMGEIAKICRLVNSMGLTIVSIASAINKDKSDTRTTVIRVNTTDIRKVCEAFMKEGYRAKTEYKVEK